MRHTLKTIDAALRCKCVFFWAFVFILTYQYPLLALSVKKMVVSLTDAKHSSIFESGYHSRRVLVSGIPCWFDFVSRSPFLSLETLELENCEPARNCVECMELEFGRSFMRCTLFPLQSRGGNVFDWAALARVRRDLKRAWLPSLAFLRKLEECFASRSVQWPWTVQR